MVALSNMTDRDVAAALLTPAGRNNPYGIYDALRTTSPIVYSSALRCWIVTRYDDVRRGFTDPRLSSRKFSGYLGGVDLDATERAAAERIRPFFSLFMLQMDPPEHTRQRGLVSRAFLPRMVDEMKPAIDRIVNGLLDQIKSKDHFDLVADVALPLPATVIMELLGVPPEGHGIIRASTEALAEFLAIVRPVPGRLEHLAAALDAADVYVRNLASERRKNPRNDLLSGMVGAMDRGDMLSEEELTVATVFLLGAGHETTANLIGNAVFSLLHVDEGRPWQTMCNDPSTIPAFVDEILRLESPLQFSGRLAAEDFEWNGILISKGQFVRLGVGAGNHDPDRFIDPRKIILGRIDTRQAGFGFGIHYCLGAALAKLEVERALLALVTRTPNLSLIEPAPVWRSNYVVRGLERLPLRLGGA